MSKQKKTLAQKMQEHKAAPPPRVIYPVLANVWKLLYFKKLGVQTEFKTDLRKAKGPFIIVCNHASRLDYIYTGIPLLPHRLNYVSAYNEFFRSHLRGIFCLLKIIPKRNFTADIHTIKEVTHILKHNGKVIIFPEGLSSVNGANQPVALGSGKMLKHFGVPVYSAVIKGGYLTNTKYNLEERGGKVEVTFDLLFTPEQLNEMTESQLQDKLNEAIYQDDYAWNKQKRYAYKSNGKMAENMHQLLYRCPRCNSEFTMKGEGDKIYCTACGNGAIVNEYYDLVPLDDTCVLPSTPKVWHDMQRKAVRAEIDSQPDYTLTGKVTLGLLPEYKPVKNKKSAEVVGEGTLTLDRQGLHYVGTKQGQPFELTFPIANTPGLLEPTDMTFFFLYHNSTYYEFTPQEETVAKWALAVEEMHRATGGKWQDCYAHTRNGD